MRKADWWGRLSERLLSGGEFPAILALALFLCIAVGAGFLTTQGRSAPLTAAAELASFSPEPAPAPASSPVPAPEAIPGSRPEKAPLVRITTEGAMRRGETLASALEKNGVSSAAVHLIATEIEPVFNFRYARPGDGYRLIQDETGQVLWFRYTRSPLQHYTIERNGEGYRLSRHDPELVRRRARIAGLVSTSLYEAVEALGEEVGVANDFAEIFAWDVDFTRGVKPGDEFSILYERLFLVGERGTETYVRPGRILAGQYSNGLQEHRAVYFEREEGRGGYYRPDGSSVKRELLRAPLNYRRISSQFSRSRLHPILKVRRPHLGVDYAAPYGTPVWAVADGTVIFRGVEGGLGRLVKVRHSDGYVSYYGHLSRYAQSLRVGQRVQQKEVLGFVGSTGLSTGPHLHFQLMKHGRPVDPGAVHSPAGEPIPPASRQTFARVRDGLLRELDPAPLAVITNEAM
jgi:murein DD-endopeptidase MepM/ murein hydrolase activator NlpD